MWYGCRSLWLIAPMVKWNPKDHWAPGRREAQEEDLSCGFQGGINNLLLAFQHDSAGVRGGAAAPEMFRKLGVVHLLQVDELCGTCGGRRRRNCFTASNCIECRRLRRILELTAQRVHCERR